MKYLTENKYWDIVEDYNLDKLLYLLVDRPDEISNLIDFVWFNDEGKCHRNYDLPACVWATHIGNKGISWFVNNKRYRSNHKPITINAYGICAYVHKNTLAKMNIRV